MPRRSAERRLIHIRAACGLALLGLLATTAPVQAQAPAADTAAGAPRSAPVAFEAEARVARLAHVTSVLLGGRALVRVSPRWWVGGAGHHVLRSVDAGRGPAQQSALTFGYGGLVTEWQPFAAPFSLRATAGAGVATVRDRVLGTRTDADVLGVFELEVAAGLRMFGPATLRVSGGYRFVFDADGIDRLDASDLRSPLLSVAVRLGAF